MVVWGESDAQSSQATQQQLSGPQSGGNVSKFHFTFPKSGVGKVRYITLILTTILRMVFYPSLENLGKTDN